MKKEERKKEDEGLSNDEMDWIGIGNEYISTIIMVEI